MNANPEKPLMTQAQYARHRNTSPQYIGKLVKAGVLVMRGRLVDVVDSDAVLDDKPAEKPATDSQQPPTSYAQASLADMVFPAKLRRLEFETQEHPRRASLDRGHRLGQGHHHGTVAQCPARHARLLALSGGPRAVVLRELLGEALVSTYSKGQPARERRPKKGVRHEALDARVYAFGALRALVSMGWSWMPRLTGFPPKPLPPEKAHPFPEWFGVGG